jgi:hypothetical protein
MVNLASLLGVLPCSSSRIASATAVAVLVALGRIAFGSQPASLHHLASLGIHSTRRRGSGTGSFPLTHCCYALLALGPFFSPRYFVLLLPLFVPSESLSLCLSSPDCSVSHWIYPPRKGYANKTPHPRLQIMERKGECRCQRSRWRNQHCPKLCGSPFPPKRRVSPVNARSRTGRKKRGRVRSEHQPIYGRLRVADLRRLVGRIREAKSRALAGRNGMQTQSLAGKARFKLSTRARTASAGSAKVLR